MKGIDFIDALSQIDPELADSYLNGATAAEQEAASGAGITAKRISQSAAAHPRRLKLLSAAGVLGSMAACAALVFGFWKLSAPELSSTEQSSEVSLISLDADSAEDSAAVTTAADDEKPTVTAAVSGEKAAAKTTAAQTAANTAKATASERKTVTSVKNADNGSANNAPASGRTNKSSAQTTAAGSARTTAAPKQTTAAPKPQKLTVPNYIGMSTEQITDQYLKQFMILFDEPRFSDTPANTICAQDIPAGTVINETDVIRVHQSLGPATAEHFPELIGKQLDEARIILQKQGLFVSPYYSSLSDLPFGTIVYAKMASYSSNTVEIALSNGLGNEIPDVIGKDYWNEVITWYGANIYFSVSKIEASDYPDGTVLSQSVAPGTPFNKQYSMMSADPDAPDNRTIVYVTISGSGMDLEPIVMPDLIGEVIQLDAPYEGSVLKKMSVFNNDDRCWAIGFTQVEDSDLPYGTIISQTPAPGTLAYVHSHVEFFVSASKNQTVSLPNPVGMSLSDAIDMIRGKGCVPIVVPEPEYDPTLPNFTVIRAEPGDLTNLKTGDGIRLIVSVSDPDVVSIT